MRRFNSSQSESHGDGETLPAPRSQRSHGEPKQSNVRSYARTVYRYSKLSTGAGYHHARLAQFFSRLLDQTLGDFQASGVLEHFVTLYRFEVKVAASTLAVSDTSSRTLSNETSARRWLIRDAVHFGSCDELVRHDVPAENETPGQLLFLKGYRSPEWLGLLGSKDHVDTEFFSQFLDFRSLDDGSSDSSVPSLPSKAWDMVEMSLITLGSRNAINALRSRQVPPMMRTNTGAALEQIHHRINRGRQNRRTANPETLANLRYFNVLLHRHEQLIKGSVLSLHSTNHAKWPKSGDEAAKNVRREIFQDFDHLHDQAEALRQRCQEEIAVLTNSMAIAESVKAIEQAERIEKSTLLAFIFVPLSFTSAFFSMNAQEVQQLDCGHGLLRVWQF
ncbi:hypothetical protein HJFPF1_08450 [Paramyrothecium foliicola]|nr:hypothetical protein HJFPF1_08450 [Paramyrothecium foliicola]